METYFDGKTFLFPLCFFVQWTVFRDDTWSSLVLEGQRTKRQYMSECPCRIVSRNKWAYKRVSHTIQAEIAFILGRCYLLTDNQIMVIRSQKKKICRIIFFSVKHVIVMTDNYLFSLIIISPKVTGERSPVFTVLSPPSVQTYQEWKYLLLPFVFTIADGLMHLQLG